MERKEVHAAGREELVAAQAAGARTLEERVSHESRRTEARHVLLRDEWLARSTAGRQVMVAGAHAVGKARVIQHPHRHIRAIPLQDLVGIVDDVAVVRHEADVERIAARDDPVGLGREDLRKIARVVLRVGQADDGEPILQQRETGERSLVHPAALPAKAIDALLLRLRVEPRQPMAVTVLLDAVVGDGRGGNGEQGRDGNEHAEHAVSMVEHHQDLVRSRLRTHEECCLHTIQHDSGRTLRHARWRLLQESSGISPSHRAGCRGRRHRWCHHH